MNNKLLLVSGLATLLAVSCYTFKNQENSSPLYAYDDISINSNQDAFTLLDKQYEANESFVYTADLHFRSGQAGGLAFGSEQNDHYYVVNMDRYENHVKLIYFYKNDQGNIAADEIRSDYFIGNDKITENELTFVNSMVRNIENVNLKVVLTRENEHAYMEFYVEGIKRFGVDSVIDLNNLGKSYSYQGGYLGINCFNSDVYLSNIEIGKSDYSYFSEPYRNQYHLQPYAKWSNDPNALCYYNGYYHVFYQTYPFGLLWGDMFWGHARSKDLIHFEYLPICLFPENDGSEFGPNRAWMWSGCAITYEFGMVDDIDSKNWFPNGNGSGLLAIFTRDGGLQDQVVMSSDDEGLTWTKRHRIPQTITGYNNKVDWRDPKVFPLKKDNNDKVTVWGMTLSSYNLNRGWFLKSENLLDWSIAGSFPLPTPECIGVGFLKDQYGEEHAYLTNKSRTYILGTLNYDEMTGQVKFIDENNVDISTYTVDNIPLKPLDFGPDSYASQSFYINDPSSDYYGKDIVLNWFSGDLNASFCTGPGEYAGLRGRWNGGFTTPVEYGVYKSENGEYRISQKPITVNNPHLAKNDLVYLENKTLSSNSINPLKDVHTHVFELTADIKTVNNSAITFKVDVGEGEYMQFGWNNIDGYYVDRTYLDDKGINTNIDWHVKYASKIMGDSDVKSFYVLSDNGGLEVFCENYSISFYFVTTASIYSTGASLKADNAVINKLELNEVQSAYQKQTLPEEGILYVSSNDVILDNKFANSRFVTCWYSGALDLQWEVLSGEDTVDCEFSNEGVQLRAKKEGSAQIKVSAGEHEQVINVQSYTANFVSDLTFEKENIVSGSWYMAGNSIIGEKASGNAFLLSSNEGADFTYTGKFDLLNGTAASLVFRAASDMSQYIVANYDANEKIVKLWSPNGEIARSEKIDLATTDLVLSVKAQERNVQVIINGRVAISCTLSDKEPLSGYFGLNVFSGKAQFKSLALAKENYNYSSGNLTINLGIDQFVTAVYNVTLGNRLVASDFYYQSNGNLYIKEEYFDLLTADGAYQFRIVGSAYTFVVNVDIELNHTFSIDDMSIEKGTDLVAYVGNNQINKVVLNGKTLNDSEYYVKDYTLHIGKDKLVEGNNVIIINDEVTFNVNVKNMEETITDKTVIVNYVPILVGGVAGGVLLLAGAAVLVLFLLKKKRKA